MCWFTSNRETLLYIRFNLETLHLPTIQLVQYPCYIQYMELNIAKTDHLTLNIFHVMSLKKA